MSIPAELTTIPQWVAWRWEQREGKRTKVPVNPATGGNASSTTPSTWGTLAQAQAAKRDGVGFVVTPGDPYCGVDIDHCLISGHLDPQAQAIVERLKSYTETTVSGEGIRIWIKARLTRPGRKKHLPNDVSVEFYDCGRFFTVTGDGGRKYPAIEARQDDLDALHREMFPDRPMQAGPMRGGALSLSDLDLLTKARAARNGDRFDRLWSGNTSDHADDDSRADLALLCHLAFWTGRDTTQMDRLFRQSGLYREKWEREDYRLRTLQTAVSHCGDIYTPGVVLVSGNPAPEGPPDEGPTRPVVDGRITITDLSAEIDDYYDHGFKPGEDPGWASLAHLYRVQRGQWTLVTGVPTHGKSTFLDALLCNLIDRHGWRFAICSPENQPLALHFAQLSEKIIGAPFHGPDRMERDEMEFAKSFLGKYVVFALPKAPTIEAILDVARAEIVENGLDGLVVDPWGTLEHHRPAGCSEGDYVAASVTRLRDFARQYQIHVWVVAHPTKLRKETKRNASGKPLIDDQGNEIKEWPVAEPYDVSGSAHWFNLADHALTIWRPDLSDNRNTVFVHSMKSRFRHNGQKGVATLLYDTRTGRFADTGIWWEHGRDAPLLDSLAAPQANPPAERPRYADPPLSEEPSESAGPFSDRRSAEATTDSAETQQGDIWGPIDGELSDDAIRAMMSPNYGED